MAHRLLCFEPRHFRIPVGFACAGEFLWTVLFFSLTSFIAHSVLSCTGAAICDPYRMQCTMMESWTKGCLVIYAIFVHICTYVVLCTDAWRFVWSQSARRPEEVGGLAPVPSGPISLASRDFDVTHTSAVRALGCRLQSTGLEIDGDMTDGCRFRVTLYMIAQL